jgi:hypothetical protein
MKYRKNDSPSKTKYQVTLTLEQLRLIDKLTECELREIENFGPNELYDRNELEKVLDAIWPYLNIELSAEEQNAATDAWIKQYSKDDYEKHHGIKS